VCLQKSWTPKRLSATDNYKSHLPASSLSIHTNCAKSNNTTHCFCLMLLIHLTSSSRWSEP